MIINNSSQSRKTLKRATVTQMVARNTPLDRSYGDVCFGRLGFMALAKSGETAGTRFLRSFDGVDWLPMTSTADNDWASVWANGYKYVAVSRNGTQATKIARIDSLLTNWVASNAPTNNPLYLVGGDHVNYHYALDTVGIIKSDNGGQTWTRDYTFTGGITVTSAQNFFISDEDENGRYVLGFIFNGTHIVWRDSHWSSSWNVLAYSDLGMETGFGDLVYRNGKWFIYGFRKVIFEVDRNFSTSPIVHDLPQNEYLYFKKVIYRNGLFLSLSDDASLKFSTDGFNFSPLNILSYEFFSSFAWGAGKFVAVGGASTGNRVPRIYSSGVSYE